MINKVVCECCIQTYLCAEIRCPCCKGFTPPEFEFKTLNSGRWLRKSLIKTLTDARAQMSQDIYDDEKLLLNEKCGVIRRRIRILDLQLISSRKLIGDR